jgi:hypothetical protein
MSDTDKKPEVSTIDPTDPIDIIDAAEPDNLESKILLNKLTEFNANDPLSSADEALEAEKLGADPNIPEPEHKPIVDPKPEPEKKWLIKDKFEDNEEGARKLAQSYKDFQSKNDKETKELKEFNRLMKEDPKALAQIILDAAEGEPEPEKSQFTPPTPPEGGLDSLDQYEEGTPTYEYIQKMDEYRENVRMEKISKLLDSKFEPIAKKEKDYETLEALEAENTQFKALGLDEDGIKLVRETIANQDNMTLANLVAFTETVTGKKLTTAPNPAIPPVAQPRNPNEKNPAAASIMGDFPPPPVSQDEAKKQVVDGFMRHSHNADGLGDQM